MPLEKRSSTDSLQEILNKLILGDVFVYVEEEDSIVSFKLSNVETRGLEKAENETVILGPQIAFTESLTTNLNVLRQSIQSTDVVFEKIMVGEHIPRSEERRVGKECRSRWSQ